MLVSFATLAFLLGCSSPSNGVVAANNVAVAGGVQEDNEIDDFARKVNSPTAGVSFSDVVLMDHQRQRVLKEGKGNQRQAMKNDEGRRALGLFDSKSPKVAPGGMDQQSMRWAAIHNLTRGKYEIALSYSLSMIESRNPLSKLICMFSRQLSPALSLSML